MMSPLCSSSGSVETTTLDTHADLINKLNSHTIHWEHGAHDTAI